MIAIKNIYYMLAYAFQVLKENGYASIELEEFKNTGDLFAAIIIKGVSLQLRRGLNQEYIETKDTTSTIRGQINIAESIKSRAILKKQLACEYSEFSINSYLNRILKTSMELLLRADISKTRKQEIRQLLRYFADVESLNLNNIDWRIQFNKNNRTYHLLISICYLLIKGLLQTNTSGSAKMMNFLDEQMMHRLYEKFILEYYRKEFPFISVNSEQIAWKLDDHFGDQLPVMQSDIMLSYNDKHLIIDAKYYSNILQSRYFASTIRSSHLYQIFAYVKNKQAQFVCGNHEVSGLLLYAKTEEDSLPDHVYRMSGNKISVKTLDLNCDFVDIKSQLNAIIADHFDVNVERM